MSTPEAPTNETLIGQIQLSGLFAGRYQIIKELAKGGMGVVYKAHDNVLDKTVALKFILYTDWTEDQLLRFQREAQASSRLQHPNIAVVYNFGLDENSTPYMVLEYVEGKTIKRIVNKRNFDILQTLQIGQQLCAALHHAHLNGLVHRDIKSSNVILDESQDPPIAKIIDFGIARVIDTQTFRGTLSSDQVVPGSPPYMAPEQVKRQPMDHRCDIYSLGCVLFEMLTGKTPFRGDTAIETMEMHVSKQPPLLQSVNKGVDFPEELEGLVAKCLAKKPEDRFQSAEDLNEALERFQEEYQESIAAKKRATLAAAKNIDPETAAKEALRKRRAAILVSAISLVGVGLAAVLYFLNVFSTDPHVETLNHSVPKKDVRIDEKWDSVLYGVKNVVLEFDIERIKRDPREVRLRMQAGDSALTEEKLKQLVPLPVETLEIFYSELPPNGVAIISNIKTLRCLKLLSDSNVNDTTLKSVARLPHLTELSISDHKDITGSVLNDFRHMSISRLNLRKLPSLKAKNLEILSKWKELDTVDLQDNLITTDEMKALRKIPNLRGLILSYSRFQPGVVEMLRELPALESLAIAETAITDDDLDLIADVKGLRALGISNCKSLTNRALVRFRQKCPTVVFLQSPPRGLNPAELKKWAPDL